MSVDYSQLEAFKKNVEKYKNEQVDQFIVSCSKRLAAELLAEVVKRTPVGDYSGEEYDCKQKISTGNFHHKGHKAAKTGGTLRRSWSIGKIRRTGKTYEIDVINPIEYATYIEYGHRVKKKDGWGWAEEHRMLSVSVEVIEEAKQEILEKKLQKFLKEVFRD